ncbi:MAG: class I SAM-dependent methyltransferase [Rikenellaceae bacterium]
MSKKYQFDNIIAETLLIPLYMRAIENQRKDPILKDPIAQQLVDSIEYDYTLFDNSIKSAVGCVIRGQYFDDAVRKFIASHKDVVVVNIGCGLDTRCQRVCDDTPNSATFYDVDLPKVMQIRAELIPAPKNNIYLSESILDIEWLDKIRAAHPSAKFIFTIEGVLMYFPIEQVKDILHNIATRFVGGEVWFDLCGKFFAGNGKYKPDSLRKHQAQIVSGIDDGNEVEQFEPLLELIEQAIYQNFNPERWQFLLRILRHAPRLSRKFSSMVGYKIGSNNE